MGDRAWENGMGPQDEPGCLRSKAVIICQLTVSVNSVSFDWTFCGRWSKSSL